MVNTGDFRRLIEPQLWRRAQSSQPSTWCFAEKMLELASEVSLVGKTTCRGDPSPACSPHRVGLAERGVKSANSRKDIRTQPDLFIHD
jgi:hypothetical protein